MDHIYHINVNMTGTDMAYRRWRISEKHVWYSTGMTDTFRKAYIYGLAQDDNNSSALAMELLQSCAKPSIRPLNERTTKGVSVPPPRDTCGVGVTKLIFSIPLLSPFLKIDQPFVIFLISSKYFVRCRHLINWTWFKGSQWYFYKIIFHKGETAKGALVIRTTGRAVIQHDLWTNKYNVYWPTPSLTVASHER